MMADKNFRGLGVGALALLCASSTAWGAGFALAEQSIRGQGASFAGGAANPVDASTVWFNPAGMTHLKGRSFAAGVHVLDIKAKFSNNSSQLNALGTAALSATLPAVAPTTISGGNDDGGENAFVPNFYYAMPVNEKLWFGMGVNVPFGLSTKYQDGWVGRYHALESTLKTINLSPSLAYKVNDTFSIGGGINIMYVDATLSSAIDLSGVCKGLEAAARLGAGTCAATGQTTVGSTATDGLGKLDGDDIGFGFNLGVMFNPNDATRIGLSFRSQTALNVKGRSDFTVPAAGAAVWNAANLFQDTGVRASVRLPASFNAAIAHDLDDRWTLLADWTHTRWSVFKELRFVYENTTQPDTVTTEEWNDSNRLAVGASYRYSDALTLRGGIAYDETPVPNAARRTARIPDSDRKWLSFGGSYQPNDNLSVDFSLTRIFADTVQINNTLESSVTTANHTLTGQFEGAVYMLGLGMRYAF